MVTLFQKITEHLFGKKYYAVTLEECAVALNDGTSPRSMGGYIFRSKEEAVCYYYQMKNGRKLRSIEIVSFRSKNIYTPFNKNYLIDIHS